MVLHLEQVIRYFSPSDFDVDYSGSKSTQVKVPKNGYYEQVFGNSIFLFHDLYISSVIIGDSIRIYDVSTDKKIDFDNQGLWESPTVPPLFGIKLPFTPACNSSLYFQEERSILNITVLSHGGTFYKINVMVYNSHGKYNLKLMSTLCFEITVQNVLCITQVSSELFFLGFESGILALTVFHGVENNETPIFSINKIDSIEELMISNMSVVKKTITSKNNSILLIIFCENSRTLCLLEVFISEINSCVEMSHILIDKLNIITENSSKLLSKVCFIENKALCTLIINDTIYFIYLTHFDSGIHKKIKFKPIFEQNFAKKLKYDDNSVIFSPQIHAVGSEVYFSRAIWNFEHLGCFNTNSIPLYEIYKLNLNFNTGSSLEKFDGFSIDCTRVWSYGLHSLWEEVTEYSLSLEISDDMGDMTSSMLLSRLKVELYKVCPSNLIFEISLKKYKQLLIKIFGKKFEENNLISKLNSINNVDDALNFIILASKVVNKSVTESGDFETIFSSNEFYSAVFLFKILLMHIYCLRKIANYCIHIFSDERNTYLLSPISFSVISKLTGDSSKLVLNDEKSELVKLSNKYIESILNVNGLIIEFIIFKGNNSFAKKNLKKMIQLLLSGNDSDHSLEIISTLFGLLSTIKRNSKIENKLLPVLKEIKEFGGLYSLEDIYSRANKHGLGIFDMNFSLAKNFKNLELELTETIFELSSACNFFDNDVIKRVLVDIRLLIGEEPPIEKLHNNDITFSTENNKLTVEFKDLIIIKNIKILFGLYSTFLFNSCNFLIWIAHNRTEIRQDNQKIKDIIPISSLFVDLSIFNIGKYFSTRKNILFGGGPQGNLYENAETEFHGNIGILLCKCLQVKSVNKFFSNIPFINFTTIFYTGGISLNATWEFFILHGFRYIVQNGGDKNTEILDLLIDNIYDQLYSGFDVIDEGKYYYYYYFANLLLFKKNVDERLLILTRKVLNNLNIVEKILDIFKSIISGNEYRRINDLLSQGILSKTLILQMSLIELNKDFVIEISQNIFYTCLLRQILILISKEIRLAPESKQVLINYFKEYMAQLVYLCRNDDRIEELIETIKKSIHLFETKFEKLWLLTTLWISFYCLSEFNCAKKEHRFQRISRDVFSEQDFLLFYSLLISLFWADNNLININLKDNAFSELLLNNSFLLRDNIYKYLTRVWTRENKTRDIIILSFLNSLKKYCEIISINKFKGKLFSKEWVNSCFRCNELLINVNYLNPKKILGEIVSYLNPLTFRSHKSCKKILLTDIFDGISSSLAIYIRNFSKLFSLNLSDPFVQEDRPFCVSRNYYCIKLPLIHLKECKESISLITYLPSIQYIFYIKWHIESSSKLFSGDVYRLFDNRLQYSCAISEQIRFFEEILSRNGVFLEGNSESDIYRLESKECFALLPTIELIYYLVIGGYCNTAFRLVEILSKFQVKYLDINSSYSMKNEKECGLTLESTIPSVIFPNLCKTLAFWTFMYCFSLVLNRKQLNFIEDFDHEKKPHKILGKRRRFEKLRNSALKQLIDQALLQNSNIRGESFGIGINIWNIVIDHLYSSPFYFEGVCLGLLVSEKVISNGSGIDTLCTSTYTFPFDLMNLYFEPESVIKSKYSFNKFNTHSFASLISIIDNYAHFNQFESAINIIETLISGEQKQQIPLSLLIKLRHLVNSSDLLYRVKVSDRIDKLIIDGVQSGMLY